MARLCLKGGRGLKSVADFARHVAVGQVVPNFPAQHRAFLLRWNFVCVWDENPARFGLRDETTEPIKPGAAATTLYIH